MNSTIQVTEVDATTTVIVLGGDQDTTTCSDFLEYATAVLDRCDRLLVDLSAVSFIDSMTLSILRAFGFAKLRGVDFETSVGQNRNVRAIVGTLNLGFQLNCRDSCSMFSARRRWTRSDCDLLGPASILQSACLHVSVSEVEVTHPRAGVVVVELHGEHDLATKHDLRSLVVRSGRHERARRGRPQSRGVHRLVRARGSRQNEPGGTPRRQPGSCSRSAPHPPCEPHSR